MNLAAYHLQCARWTMSRLIEDRHEFWVCGSDGAECEELHDVQRDISAALTLMGERLCRLPFPPHVDFRPEGWIEPLHPDAWYE